MRHNHKTNSAMNKALTVSNTRASSGRFRPHADNANDRIPAHVWELLAESGEAAAVRLLDLLTSQQFPKLKGSEQVALVRLGFEYAYGKPDAPLKRAINVNLSTDNADAVQAALARLAAKTTSGDYDPGHSAVNGAEYSEAAGTASSPDDQ